MTYALIAFAILYIIDVATTCRKPLIRRKPRDPNDWDDPRYLP